MKRLVLVGAGHAHAQVLRDRAASRQPDCDLVLVSPHAHAPYSGMVPGWIAGHYRFDEICIDFAALAAAAGARFLIDEVDALDADRNRLRLRSGLLLDYDVLSLNAGSTLSPPVVPGCTVLSMRPLGELREAWESALAGIAAAPERGPLRLTAVGGGAAGVEAVLAVRARLARTSTARPVQGALVTRDHGLLAGIAPGAVRRIEDALAAAHVAVRTDTAYPDTDAAQCPPDLLLWATGAEAHAWQRACGLAVSDRGFIRIDRRLRSLSHPQVFAVGDCAEWAPPLPKAGVYAVRMGPVLSRNLRAALGSGTPIEFSPQRRFLVLLATGDRRAVASWGRWSAGGRWVWRWKDRIDRRFVRGFAPGA